VRGGAGRGGLEGKKWRESFIISGHPAGGQERHVAATHTATDSSTLQHTVTRRNTPQDTAKHCNAGGQERHIAAKEPCISAKEPCIAAKEPCISAKEPYNSANKSCVSANETCVSANEEGGLMIPLASGGGDVTLPVAGHVDTSSFGSVIIICMQQLYNTLQQTSAQCNTLHYATVHWNTL